MVVKAKLLDDYNNWPKKEALSGEVMLVNEEVAC